MTRELRLKDLGRWRSGGTPPKERDDMWMGDMPWLSAKDIDRDLLREPTAFITEEAAHAHSRVVAAGSILAIVRGMALAHGLPLVMTDRRVAFNQDLRALEVGRGFEPRYVYYALRGHRHRLDAHIDRAAHGTARVTHSICAERIAILAKAKQAAVADFLDFECERITDLGRECAGLVGRSFSPALARFDELSRGWNQGRIGYRFSVQLGKMLDEKRINPEDVRPYLRNANVQWDHLILEGLKEMTFSPKDRARYDLRPGDLLVCEGGQPGRSAIWDDQVKDCYFQKALMRVRPRRSGDSTRYLMWCLRLASERGDLAADGTGATIRHLPAERLIATRVPVPPPDTQLEIVREVDALAQRGNSVAREVQKLRGCLAEYRDALIAEAVTGRLDPARLSSSQLDESAHAAMEGERPDARLS